MVDCRVVVWVVVVDCRDVVVGGVVVDCRVVVYVVVYVGSVDEVGWVGRLWSGVVGCVVGGRVVVVLDCVGGGVSFWPFLGVVFFFF